MRASIDAHAKELPMSLTGIVHIGLITDRSDWFKAQVEGFQCGKVSTFGGYRIYWALGPICDTVGICLATALLQSLAIALPVAP